MTKSRLPEPLPSPGDEFRRTNVLLEAMQKNITLLAEGMVDLRHEVTGLKQWRTTVTDDLAVMKSILQQHTRILGSHERMLTAHRQDMAETKTSVHRIEHHLGALGHRLTAVEVKRGA